MKIIISNANAVKCVVRHFEEKNLCEEERESFLLLSKVKTKERILSHHLSYCN